MKIYINYGKKKEVFDGWLKSGWHHIQIENEYYFLMASVPTNNKLEIKGTGYFEQFFDMENRKYAELFWIDDSIIHFQFSDNFSEEDKAWFTMYYGNERLDRESSITLHINQTIEGCFSNDPSLKLFYDWVLNATNEFTHNLYTTKCLNCDDENLDENIIKMRSDGYYSILENEVYLDQLIKYSILSSFSITEKNDIKEFSGIFELGLPEEPIDLYKKLKKYGFFNLWLSPNNIKCMGL